MNKEHTSSHQDQPDLLDRREFLQQSSLAAGALALPAGLCLPTPLKPLKSLCYTLRTVNED